MSGFSEAGDHHSEGEPHKFELILERIQSLFFGLNYTMLASD